MKGLKRSVVAVMGLVALLVSGMSTLAWAHETEPLLNLSMSAGESRAPQVAISGSSVYVVWLEDDDLLFRRSLDGGRSFEPPVVLSGGGRAVGPQLVALQDRVYVVWYGFGIHFRASSDRGRSFGPILDLGMEPSGSIPRLAASGRHVYVVWPRGISDENGDVLFRASHDCGRTFGPILDLTPDTRFGGARVATRGETVHVIWDDGGSNDSPNLFYRRSTNAGATFDNIMRLNGPSDVDGFELAVEGDAVHVAWQSREDVFFRRSLDEGATFGPSVNLGDSLGLTGPPALLVRDNRVYVASPSFVEGRRDVLLTQSFDRGETFLAPMNVSDSPGLSIAPLLVRAGSGVRVFWAEGSFTDFDIYSRATRRAGPKLGPIENLSGTPGTTFGYAAASNGSRAHLVWADNSGGNFDIFYRRLDATTP